MADFSTAYAIIEANEHRLGTVKDDLHDHPNDRGKLTYKGISRKHNGNWPGWVIVDRWRGFEDGLERMAADTELQKLVVDFYLAIWDRLKCEQIDEQEIANELLDAAVNCGENAAIRFLQATLNYLLATRDTNRFLAIDGKIGLMTLSILKQTIAKLGIERVVVGQRVRRGAHYFELVKQSPDQAVNFAAWIERLNLTAKESAHG